MMYPLFELVKLISFDHGQKASISPQVGIQAFAWKEVGEINMLALVCSNGYLVLRCSVSGKDPVIRQIPWLENQQVISLCFDPTATWLLILSSESEMYIIPALPLLDSEARVNQLWSLDDVTSMGIIPPPKDPSVVCWWHTLDDNQVAIVGTKTGNLVFVDLRRRKVLTEAGVSGAVKTLQLIPNDEQMSTHLLVTLEDGQQWKLLLECQNSEQWRKIHDQDWTDVAYDRLQIVTLLQQTESNKHLFYPLRFYQFKDSVHLSPEYAKGRHFIAAHDNKTCQYQILDSRMEQSPLFVYQVPLGAMNLILSDKVMFCTTTTGEMKLNILSNQKAETSMGDQQEFNKDAIFQEFTLPEGEKLKAVCKKSFPFYWHEKREEIRRATSGSYGDGDDTLAIPITSHSVLDGCIVITNKTVYECRPRVSPERLFLDLSVNQSDPSVAENLGIGLGLDVHFLFELVAEFKLSQKDFHQAVKLYQLSKCSHTKRVTSFAKHGCIQEVMTYLKQVLTNQKADVNTKDKKSLADMALYCYVHQLQESSTSSAGAAVLNSFRDFLLGSFSYNERTALELLAKHRLNDLLLELAKARGCILEALQLMVQDGCFEIDKTAAENLITRGFGAHLARVNEGAFLRCMEPGRMCDILCLKPQIAITQWDLLEPVIPYLEIPQLLNLAHTFDPSRPLISSYLRRGQRSRERAISLNSLASFTSEFGDNISQDSTGPDSSRLVHFFLSVVLTLNKKRGHPDQRDLLSSMLEDTTTNDESERETEGRPPQRLLVLRPSPIGCGAYHSALVRNGDLYTSGRAQSGRLGHGDLTPENSVCPATRVQSLHMLQIQVLSVACGGEHTVAITQQGVFSWGSSHYGQVGVGTSNQSYSRPMLVETLSEVVCVSVACGQYHTLALTAQGRVYSWGWGVHGQLGHGNAEDCLVPTQIEALSSRMVTCIAAGYCHSVVLTAEGEVYTFGCGLFGQLGHGSGSKQSVPRKVEQLPGKVVHIATKYFHTLALLPSNQIYSWGCHPMSLRQTAHMIKRHRSTPVGHHQRDVVERFLLPYNIDTSYVHSKIIQVSCGSHHNALITVDGEVFMWGRNIDGQLGTGSRQDSRHPVMLTTINDRSVNHLKCGAEFTIAMDTDFLVWVWGKNDSGQLGMGLSEGQTRSNPPKPHYSKKSPSTMMSDIIQPTALSGIPSVTMTTSWQRIARSISVESSDSGGGLWSVESYEDMEPQTYLPDLEKVTSPSYSIKILPILLKHLGERCNLVRLSRECVDCKDWLSAAEIHRHQQHYPQALGYHLKYLTSNRGHLGNLEDFIGQTAKILDFYIRHLKQSSLPEDQQFLNWRSVLLKLFQFWDDNHLPVPHLESTLTTHLDNFIKPLGLLLFRAEDSTKSTVLGIPPNIRKKIKTKFQLAVLVEFLKILESEEISGEISQVFGECLNKDGRLSNLGLKSTDKLIPYDRLCHEVIQNVRKDWDMRNYVYLTARDIELLRTKMNSGCGSDYEKGQQEQTRKSNDSGVFVFTCGHHSTARAFFKDQIPYLQKEIGMGSKALPKTATVLSQYYSRSGLIPMACPNCVLSTVRT